ncbi:MAG: hypothetical protein FWC13_10215 [Oscillospiraceae bacterium]|nr:hypothetical protein [Oscillospiraceae bacterium]MCL2249633.1 hypothetical protein [Oscillospiraceae bacterium]
MKRSDFFIRLTTAVLFLAVATYIGVYLYSAITNTFVTEAAIRYSIEETLPVEGFIIRTETVLYDAGTSVLPVVGEGERVGVGQAVAIEFMTAQALETASEIRSLNMQITQLESNRNVTDSEHMETIRELSAAVNTMDLRRLEEISMNIETTIFDVATDIEALRSRLEELELRSDGTRTIAAPVSGTFTHIVDGFEHITPDIMTGVSPSELRAHFETPGATSGAGKLVTAFKWYFAAIINHEDAIRLSTGSRINVSFTGVFQGNMEMLVESISRREGDHAVVLLSSDRGIHDTVALREVRAEIVTNVTAGIRVPMEAIHLDENGTTFVFLQTSAYAERVDVEILGETGDVFIVRDGIETGSPLRAESTIIVRGNNLYHGKVVG